MQERISYKDWRTEPVKTRQRPRELEHIEQVALIKWKTANRTKYPELEMLFAIPNGGKRSKVVAGKLKAEGVVPGVPDLCLPVPRGGFHALFIELKSLTGYPTAEQKEWIERLTQQGYLAVVRKGWEAARDEIVNYLAMAE